MALRFEWDPDKARRNRKHRLSFEEATTAFDDDSSLTVPDPRHSVGEERCSAGRSAVASSSLPPRTRGHRRRYDDEATLPSPHRLTYRCGWQGSYGSGYAATLIFSLQLNLGGAHPRGVSRHRRERRSVLRSTA